MKHLKTFVIILLNVLFCIITIWLFVRNSVLRPYTGSLFKESLSAVLVLGSLYACVPTPPSLPPTTFSSKCDSPPKQEAG